ncbi:MAG: ABC transporter ATP-binding protein [Limnochordales bacterium]|nr:ABC transporter ATP-binding protein [Limnochordales bacterium]
MLRVEAVQAGYGAVKVLKGIRLHVPEGKIVALIGANGAGKTTTLRVIAGQLRPWSGRVTFAGRDISQRPAHVRPREGLVHVPEGRAILARMTVEENLEMGAYVRRGPDVKQDLERVFARFPRLLERRRQLAGTLSGGEQQMLALGRALMARPRLLLLDEPSMGLAPLVTAEIFQLIQEINRDGTTILLVEQNARQALRIAHHAYVMETGQIVLEGPAAELIHNRRVIDAYLGGTSGAAGD